MITIEMVGVMTIIIAWWIRVMLRIIVGWGVVPRMAPPPSKEGSTLGKRERKRNDKRERERLRENYVLFIHSLQVVK